MRSSLRLCLVIIFGLLLSACGGGGGGGASDQGFSASPTSLAFTAVQGGNAPGSQSVAITATNSKTAYVGAAWKGTAPSWCTPRLTGSGTHWSLSVQIYDTSLPPDTYSATLTAGIADASNSILATQDIAITYTVTAVLGASPASLDFSYAQGAAAPAGQSLAVSGSGRSWQAAASQAWIKLGAASGTAPSSLAVTVDPAGLAAGAYQGTVTLTHPGGADSVVVPVALTVAAAALVTDAPSLAFSGVNGAPQGAQTLNLGLNNGAAGTWTATADSPWLVLGATSGTLPGSLAVTVDPSQGPLASGAYDATIVIRTGTGAGALTKIVPVHLALTRPALSVTPSSLTLGGTNGRDFSAQDLQVGLNTGTAAYAWTAAGDHAWVAPGATSGNASANPATVSVAPLPTGLAGGTYTGTLTFSATVNGDHLSAAVAVALNLEAHQFLADDTGVAFASMPGLARTTRTLKVRDSFGLATAWTAVSDQPWLTVTPRGTAPGDLVLNADPTGLAADSLSYATVTLTAPGTENTERIRVGFWVGAAAPPANQVLPAGFLDLAMDPIRPYVYLSNGTGDIQAFHLYTGAKVATYHSGPAQFNHMTVANDGSTLFASNATTFTVVPIDLATGTLGTPWTYGSGATGIRLEYLRRNGVSYLFTANGGLFEAATGRLAAGLYQGAPSAYGGDTNIIATSFDGSRLLVTSTWYAPTDVLLYTFDRTSLNGGLATVSAPRQVIGDGTGSDCAFSADGTLLYSGCLGTAQVYDASTLHPVMALPCGDIINVELARDGRIFAGIFGLYQPADVFVYAPDGTPLGSYKLGGYNHYVERERMKVAGDGLQMVTITNDSQTQVTTVGP